MTSTPFTSEPVGPASASSSRRTGIGHLQVYSETIAHNDGNIPYFPHSSYTVHAPDGTQVKGVQNHIGMEDEIPTVVALPSGTYNVIAQSAAFGRVIVPVIIQPGVLTPVFLERGGMPDRRRKNADDSEADFVRGPDNKIVGYRIRGEVKKE